MLENKRIAYEFILSHVKCYVCRFIKTLAIRLPRNPSGISWNNEGM